MSGALDRFKARKAAAFGDAVPPVQNFAPQHQPLVIPPPGALARKKQMVADLEMDDYAEVRRIVEMPIVPPLSRDEREEINRRLILAPAYESGFRFFDVQADAIGSYLMTSSLFGTIGVGWGKTLIGFVIAHLAYMKGLQKIVLMVPPRMMSQLLPVDLPWARKRVPISYPIHILGGRAKDRRGALAKSGKKGLYVMTYSLLSCPDSYDLLQQIKPELIISDEAHHLGNRSAARTKRFMHIVSEFRPEGAVMSGTVTGKSVMDYHHLARWCLDEYNPLPNATAMATEWSAIIDSGGLHEEHYLPANSAGTLEPLIKWASAHFDGEFKYDVAGFRRAYQARLFTSPAVVTSGADDIGTALVLANNKVDGRKAGGWEHLEMLIKQVNDAWLTPNGDEIEHAIHTFKWLYELSAGFYNQLTWATPEQYARKHHMTVEEAEIILGKSKDHHALGQEYARVLRTWLNEKSWPGCDTPMLVGREMLTNGADNVGYELHDAWVQYHKANFDGRPDRDSSAVRVCDYKVAAAVKWAQGIGNGHGALVWYYHQEMGDWLAEAFEAAGLDTMHCPAGERHNKAVIDHDNSKKFIIASITAHGEGKNLQHFQHNYVVQWPRPAKIAEQLLGRTHRNGQKADELVICRNDSLEFDELVFAASLNDSLYIHQTTGVRQKMIYARYDPLPRIFPSQVLRERGLQNKLLSDSLRRVLEDQFTEGKN